MELAAGESFFVVAGAFHPYFTPVRFDNPSGNGQSQARPRAFENGFAGGVEGQFAGLIKFGKNQLVQLGINANTGIADNDFYAGEGVLPAAG